MKNLGLTLSLFLTSLPLFAQTSTTSATYSSGQISSDDPNNITIATVSNCAADLTVNVPAGRYVTSVQVEYQYEAINLGWRSEQRSYVECITTGTKESAVAFGPPQNSAGTVSYNRTGLTFANGIVPAGGLTFRIHAFRTFGGNGCGTNVQRILNNTFEVTVTHDPAPTCPPPSAPSVSNITANSADLSWTSGGASNWQVEYWPTSSPSNTTIVSAANNPFTLSGLNASTTYNYRVRDSCGVSDVSYWTNTGSFKTACATISAPWTENFDSPDWVPSTGLNVGSIDTCFTRNYSNEITWEAGPPQFISPQTGPSSDHTTGSGGFMFSEVNAFGTFPDTAIITTPSIDLSPLTVPELTYWYHMFGNSIGELKVQISTNGGSSFTTLVTKTGEQQTSNNDPWKEEIVSLSSYAGSTVILRFLAIQPTFGTASDVAIDDVDIHETPACPKPTNLGVIARSFNEITLSWTSGGASDWQIEYGSPGFTPGSGTLVNASTNPFTITGLTPSTSYEFIVRDSCGAGSVSAWSTSVTSATYCSVVSAPYQNTFDGSQWDRGTFNNDPGTIDACWNRDIAGNFFFKTGPAFFTGASGAAVDHTTGTASGGYVYSERVSFGGSDTAEISSVLVDLGPLTAPELTFWYHMFGADISKLEVLVSDDFGLNYSTVYTRNGQQQNGSNAAWKEAVVNLSAYAGDTILVKFRSLDQNNGFSSNVCIDDFNIQEQPSCPKPQDLVVVGMTSTTATLSWQSGGASNWHIEYGSPGFTPGNGTLINASANPFTVTGLSPNTAYDFYVRDSCGTADVSAWVGAASDTTDCNPVAAPYTENFDGTTWVVPTFFNDPGDVDPCWDRLWGLDYMWKPEGTNTNFGSGPANDHTTGSDKFLQADRLFGVGLTQSNVAVIESPLIDLSPLTIPELSFWYHMFGADIDSLIVDVFDGSSWNNELVLSGQQQTSKTDAWKEAIVNISSYANDTIKVRFTAVRMGGGFDVNTAIDDVDIHEQPTCPKPSGLNATNTTANSVTLSWTSGGASNWQIEYGPAGFVQGNGTVVNAGTNPFTVTGLNSSTTYDFYVRDSCSSTDLSDWYGTATASTSCLPLVAPFTENFDGSQWVVGPNFNDTGSIAQCWIRNPVADYLWKPGPPAFAGFNTGPSADHTSGNGKYLYTESIFSGGNPPFNAFLETPEIDLSALTDPELTFWYHMYGDDIGSLEVEVDDGSGYTSVYTRNGEQQFSSNDPWKEAIISLTSYANDTIRIRFKANKTVFGTQSDLAIDDIVIDEAPNCPKPTNLSGNPTSDGFVVSWTTGGAANWQIEYGPPGFTPGSGTIINVNSNPYTITGLSSNTGYDIYVRDSCGAGDVSAWSPPYSDTTLCAVFSTPHSENFDGSPWVVATFVNDPGDIDPCWDRSDLNGYYWKAGQNGTGSFNTGPSQDHTTGSGKYMFTESFGGNNDSTSFLSPLFDLSTLTNPQVRFWYHMYGADIDKLDLQVWDGTSWSNVNTVSGQQQSSETSAWVEEVINLSSFANDTVRFRFVGHRTTTGFQGDIAIDDFWLGEAPSCPRPNNLSITSSTTNSITISWTTGGASNWLVGYRPTGSTGPLNIVSATTNPFTISGLSPSTSYTIFVKDSCAAGDVSLWEGPESGSTACGIPTAPWSENFDGADWVQGTGATNTGNQISQCWSRPNSNNPNFGPSSGPTTSVQTGPNSDVSGSGKFIYTEASGGASGTGEITSPMVFIPTSLVNPQLKFAYHIYGDDINNAEVEIGTGGSFSNVKTYNGQQQFSNAAPWIVDSVDLNPYKGDTIQIRFKGTNNGFNGDVSFDEVKIVSDPVQCPDPSNISFNNITPTSADVSWVSGSGNSELEVVPVGQPQGSGTLYTGVSSPFNINSLQPNSSYVIYIRDSCSSTASGWINDTLTTNPCPVVSADFSYNTNILKVNYNSGGTTNQDSVYWNFGDGSDTSVANPSYTYDSAGTYIVSLYAFNLCDSDTLVDTVTVCDTLTADFSSSQSGDTVILDAGSSQGASSYYWDLGNGSDTTGALVNYMYSTAGSKIVTLTVVNACGDSATKQKTVKVCLPPVASWNYTIISTTGSGMKVQFDATASQNANSYEWDFGDGNTATGAVQPVHTYVTPGLFYIVTLKITNDCGDSNSSKVRLSEVELDEYSLSSLLKVYPNPARDFVTTEWPAEDLDINSLEIIDVSGRIVLRQANIEARSGSVRLDVSQLTPGYFTLRINSDKGSVAKQLIIR